ncbi:SLC13 family permease [Sorangium sp. So ce302]|uniref:SLC13 family permease n=1 Tax=Sorangium sp. So ce302 TaxID=3133297 RepID=UPI003F61F8C8
MPSSKRAIFMSSSDADHDDAPDLESAADDSNAVAVRPPPSRPAPPRPADRVRVVLPLSLTIAAGIAVVLPATLPAPARIALFAVLLAIILWSTTSLDVAYVGLGAALLLLLTGVSPQERLFDSLASDVIWLMIGAFILGGAVEQSGLAMRLAQRVVERARTVRGLFWCLTAVLIPSSLFVPSVSGRALIAIPIFRSISSITEDPRITRALALLFPTVILVSTIGSLVGAGSHLVANQLLSQVTGRRLSFGEWILYGMPFGMVASGAACAVIMALFLDGERRGRCIRVPRRPRGSLSRSERITLAVGATMVVLWLSERWHGYESATVTLAGALVLTAPGSALRWKEGVKAVDWNLLLFVGAALVLGGALIDTGASGWLFQALLRNSGIESARGRLFFVVAVGVMSLTSHLYLTSHVARIVALGPVLLQLAADRALDPAAVIFIGTVGIDYCLTFPVSSKALLMFQGLDGETFRPADLLLLSAVLLPIHLASIAVFYFTYWRWMGLAP